MKRPHAPITAETIHQNSRELSANQRFAAIAQRRAEQEEGWFVRSAGWRVGDFFFELPSKTLLTDGAIFTESKLVGSADKLKAETVVSYSHIRLPKETSDEAIEHFFTHSHEDASISEDFGYIYFNEPGFSFLNPIYSEGERYFNREMSSEHVAIEGLIHFLNDPDAFLPPDEVESLQSRQKTVEKHIQEIFSRNMEELRDWARRQSPQ